jgi:hypothetical protein
LTLAAQYYRAMTRYCQPSGSQNLNREVLNLDRSGPSNFA